MAAASLFAAACGPHDDGKPASGSASAAPVEQFAKVECHGVNACKGKSECMTPANECAGQNACKGKGFVKTTPAECQARGGVAKSMQGM